MILTETVHLKPHGTQIKYFKERGYQFNSNEEIDVKVEDLQPHSGTKIRIACDLCDRKKMETLDQYNKMVSRGGYYVCLKCRQKKVMETNQERYGGNTPFASKEVWDKALNTMKEKYGYEYSTQCPELKQKIHKTVRERYGCDTPAQNALIREKIANTLYNNSSQKSSKQQRYICDLYDGVLNYPIGYYNADILLPSGNIIVEYNGGGHLLNVISNKYSEEEQQRKENARYFYLKSKGYKQITIISKNDNIPTDDVLLDMLNNGCDLLSQEHCHWVEYNIDEGVIRCSLDKCGTPYFYGELRKIRKENE